MSDSVAPPRINHSHINGQMNGIATFNPPHIMQMNQNNNIRQAMTHPIRHRYRNVVKVLGPVSGNNYGSIQHVIGSMANNNHRSIMAQIGCKGASLHLSNTEEVIEYLTRAYNG
eukprot:801142_1